MEINGIEYTGQAVKYQEEIEEELFKVLDTEIGLDVVNLGLIYEVSLDDEGNCHICLTFTSAGCPCAEEILNDLHYYLEELEFIKNLDISIVWSPAWEMTRITRVGRISLGINPGR